MRRRHQVLSNLFQPGDRVIVASPCVEGTVEPQFRYTADPLL